MNKINKFKSILIVLISIIITIVLTGCSLKSYEVAKTIYLNNKKIIIENYDDLSPYSKSLIDKLESVDEIVIDIDKKIDIYKQIKENIEIKTIEIEE